MQFGIDKPVSPQLQFIMVDGDVAIYHKIVYNEDCDEFEVVEVCKYDVETGEKQDD